MDRRDEQTGQGPHLAGIPQVVFQGVDQILVLDHDQVVTGLVLEQRLDLEFEVAGGLALLELDLDFRLAAGPIHLSQRFREPGSESLPVARKCVEIGAVQELARRLVGKGGTLVRIQQNDPDVHHASERAEPAGQRLSRHGSSVSLIRASLSLTGPP